MDWSWKGCSWGLSVKDGYMPGTVTRWACWTWHSLMLLSHFVHCHLQQHCFRSTSLFTVPPKLYVLPWHPWKKPIQTSIYIYRLPTSIGFHRFSIGFAPIFSPSFDLPPQVAGMLDPTGQFPGTVSQSLTDLAFRCIRSHLGWRWGGDDGGLLGILGMSHFSGNIMIYIEFSGWDIDMEWIIMVKLMKWWWNWWILMSFHYYVKLMNDGQSSRYVVNGNDFWYCGNMIGSSWKKTLHIRVV